MAKEVNSYQPILKVKNAHCFQQDVETLEKNVILPDGTTGRTGPLRFGTTFNLYELFNIGTTNGTPKLHIGLCKFYFSIDNGEINCGSGSVFGDLAVFKNYEPGTELRSSSDQFLEWSTDWMSENGVVRIRIFGDFDPDTGKMELSASDIDTTTLVNSRIQFHGYELHVKDSAAVIEPKNSSSSPMNQLRHGSASNDLIKIALTNVITTYKNNWNKEFLEENAAPIVDLLFSSIDVFAREAADEAVTLYKKRVETTSPGWVEHKLEGVRNFAPMMETFCELLAGGTVSLGLSVEATVTRQRISLQTAEAFVRYVTERSQETAEANLQERLLSIINDLNRNKELELRREGRERRKIHARIADYERKIAHEKIKLI